MSKTFRLPVARARVMHSHTPGQMNKTEERYRNEDLQLLKSVGEIAEYWFEAVTFKLAHDTRYTPDFMVLRPDGTVEFHEVKGTKQEKPYFADPAGRAKVAVAAKLFPLFQFRIVWRTRAGWQDKEVAGG